MAIQDGKGPGRVSLFIFDPDVRAGVQECLDGGGVAYRCGTVEGCPFGVGVGMNAGLRVVSMHMITIAVLTMASPLRDEVRTIDGSRP